MFHDAQEWKRLIRRLKISRKLLRSAALLTALLVPLGIVALRPSQANDHAASTVPPPPVPSAPATNQTAPAIVPLPPQLIPKAPTDAASTTVSDDSAPTTTTDAKSAKTPPPTPVPTASPAITPLQSTPLPSTDLPSITLPPPVQPSIRQPTSDSSSAPKNPAQSSLHVEVMPASDWTPPADAAAISSADTKSESAADRVTPASAAIPEATAVELPPDKATQTADDLPDLPPLQVEAAQFKDIQPGVTTADELIQQWGEGKLLKQKDGTQQRVYKQDLYPRVSVTIEKKKVSTIDAQLDQPTETDVLAQRLHLDLDSSVPVLDDNGQTLGQSYPDRGLLFSYDPGTKLVSQILLESIDPQPFLVRATTEAELHPGWCLRDVNYALQLDPKHAETHDIRAQMLLSIGRPGEALKSERRSVELAPENAAFVLSKAAILARLDQREDAIKLTQTIVDRTDLPRLLKAHALCQLADLTAAGSPENGKRAIDLYMSAIKTAQPLASDQRVNVRRLAKRVLLDAHLGAATEIAWGVWQKKSVTVERWIKQADQLAKDLIEHEEADPQLRLEVARRAVSAAAGIDGNWNASEWTQQALDTGRKLIEETDDPLRREQLEWELGTALVDALELQRTAGLDPQSLAHAMAVLKYLQSGIQYRQRTPETTYILGRVYFQIGVIHAVVNRDHATAVLWFDRAKPFLDRPLPASAAPRIGRNGELLVSMGISYWQTGRKEEGLRLTQKGTDLMAKAVSLKLLNDGALAVPYGNLASMHKQLGHSEQARSFSEMAAQHDTVRR